MAIMATWPLSHLQVSTQRTGATWLAGQQVGHVGVFALKETTKQRARCEMHIWKWTGNQQSLIKRPPKANAPATQSEHERSDVNVGSEETNDPATHDVTGRQRSWLDSVENVPGRGRQKKDTQCEPIFEGTH